ncbi:hypothetical protein [Streptomyces sp. NPDC018610]|uniref:hypothetical protein n=1 Tax=Streptomyces sp. NPDC018610 TaxID=3365049 RepID=UPI003794AE28
MPDPAASEHFLAGRLLAALWTARLLAGDGGTPPEADGFPEKAVPAKLLDEGMKSLTGHLVAARSRGTDRWEAAAEVFRGIPALLPREVPDKTMGAGEQKAFTDGYAEQLATHAEKYGRLLKN